ncbi:hypothetical protein B566_EDAN013786 [Ephemera danica]|nr:hypothetical protein B566_EDAN013786 [Ephemera danica]
MWSDFGAAVGAHEKHVLVGCLSLSLSVSSLCLRPTRLVIFHRSIISIIIPSPRCSTAASTVTNIPPTSSSTSADTCRHLNRASSPTMRPSIVSRNLGARNKPADGSGHVNQKGQAGQKGTPTTGSKGSQGKTTGQKPAQKPTAQKGQVKAPPKAASANKPGKKNKKGQRHQQHDLIVTIDLVSLASV